MSQSTELPIRPLSHQGSAPSRLLERTPFCAGAENTTTVNWLYNAYVYRNTHKHVPWKHSIEPIHPPGLVETL